MSIQDDCTLQYLYPSKELQEKYKINCSDKFFLNYENFKFFNNSDFLEFVNKKYGDDAFSGDSPFIFKDKYIGLSNAELCNPTEYSLKPQQKFVGQVVNPSTNIKSSLVFHGLGSGKTCTSLVVGEAFKSTTKTHLLYVVPAPLIQQYRDEIIGELKEIDGKNEIWSCTSQCVITRDQEKDEPEKGDMYTNVHDQLILKFLEEDYNTKKSNLFKLQIHIESLREEDADPLLIKEQEKKFFTDQNMVNKANLDLMNFKEQLLMKVTKVFEIVSHTKFIFDLFKELKDGKWQKQKYLLDTNSPLLNKGSLLVIDEIQRLISAEGKLYKKLETAIYQYAHPDLRILLLSATPIYDNPYELALTMNILRPRIPFPISKEKFYSFFLGKYDYESEKCLRVEGKNFITEDSCLINKRLLKYLCSGYVSYFRGGNPNAYPYKRVINIEHKMPGFQKSAYVKSLRSDIKKDTNLYSKLSKDENKLIELFSKDNNEEKEDKVSGIYVNTQQISNIALPVIESDIITNLGSKKGQQEVKKGLNTLKSELKKIKPKTVQSVLAYLRQKGYSEKFCSIIELSNNATGPVFIFSNWLQFGVEALAIILDACGYKKFPSQGEQRYFIWSSETSSQKDLISEAKATFNSIENKDGNLLKIILGTRSIMEGVSFKNVKQVHITDPWWNESRIEQILARAVRFCSHSLLPINEQWTDIFRHYSALPMKDDPEIIEMLREVTGSKKFKNFNVLSIEQKMVISAQKKLQINNEFDDILKETAYDCDINYKGNIIRLEEIIRPLPNGNFQICFKNPNNLLYFLRKGIPLEISFKDILERKYSFPNTDELELEFIECVPNELNILVPSDDDPVILNKSNLTDNLTLYEDIDCWKNNQSFEEIIKLCDQDIQDYFIHLINNFDLISLFRKNILGEKSVGNKIKFNNTPSFLIKSRNSLFKCLQATMDNPDTPSKLRTQIKKLLQSEKSKNVLDKKIIDIIYTYKLLPENMIDTLLELDSKTISDLYNEAKLNN